MKAPLPARYKLLGLPQRQRSRGGGHDCRGTRAAEEKLRMPIVSGMRVNSSGGCRRLPAQGVLKYTAQGSCAWGRQWDAR